MATGGLYGSSPNGALVAGPNSDTSGLYGGGVTFGGTYFEWFIFKESATQPATPTGGSWSFVTNTGTPPTGWTLQPPTAPVNQIWVSIALVNSKSGAALSWSVPGLLGTIPYFTFGAVITGAPGTNASLVNTGTAINPNLIFTIPRGDTGATGATGPQGPTGTAATISVGSTTTGAAGTSASVTNVGTSSAAVFNFTIPRGDTGATGATGATGSAATIAVGTTTTTAPGTSATVTNSGTSSAAVFNFGIPRGAGVVAGGTTGQVLTKASSTDYDTTWTTITGGLNYQGSWNASTNSPTLTSSVGTNGYYYVVSVSGSTNLNGITDWVVGDWAIFNGTIWQKIDQTNLVTSVAGRTGAVVLSNTDISGLGTMSTQNANAVAITGGSISGLSSPLPVASGGTGVIASTGANSVVLRDANGNITTNCLFEGYVTQAASGTTITLIASSAQNYQITGSGGQVIKLPDATTLPNGATFTFNNNQSSGAITVQNNSSTTVATINSGGYVTIVLLSNSTAAGSWDRHDSTPSNVSWSTNTLDYAGSITSATWNGTTVAINRGGTGQTTASAAFNALSPITTTGDLIIGNGTNSATRLGIGTNGYVLTSNGTTATWSASTGGVTSFSAGTTGLTPSTATTGAVTLAGTLAVANGGTGVTTSTGSGSNVLSTSPTLVTPVLGTPTSVTLTNGTGLPISTGVSGLGTGVATALAVNVGTAGSPLVNGGVLGTPSSGTLTNATGLPLTSGVTGTLPIANGGTGQTTANTAFNALVPSQTSNSGKYLTTDGSNTSWATVVSGASISNDTTTSSNLYPLFAAATSGVPTTIYTGNTKYLYKPSTGELTAPAHISSNGININSATVSSSYTIASGNNGMSVGPITVATGQSVTVSSGQRWVVL